MRTCGIVNEYLKTDDMVFLPYSFRYFNVFLIDPARITGEQDQQAEYPNNQ
jgi:hypothetical protein